MLCSNTSQPVPLSGENRESNTAGGTEGGQGSSQGGQGGGSHLPVVPVSAVLEVCAASGIEKISLFKNISSTLSRMLFFQESMIVWLELISLPKLPLFFLQRLPGTVPEVNTMDTVSLHFQREMGGRTDAYRFLEKPAQRRRVCSGLSLPLAVLLEASQTPAAGAVMRSSATSACIKYTTCTQPPAALDLDE